jgi:hypothetical protein
VGLLALLLYRPVLQALQEPVAVRIFTRAGLS